MAMMMRNFDIFRPTWNYFDPVFQQMEQAHSQMEMMRHAMFQLMPQDMATDMETLRFEPHPMGQQVIMDDKGGKQLKVEFDVHDFKPEEIKVKLVEDNTLQVTADHEEKTNTGHKHRMFERRYLIPHGVEVDKMTPILTQDGVLSIVAPAPGVELTHPTTQLPIEHHEKEHHPIEHEKHHHPIEHEKHVHMEHQK
jgi:HSP20 family molecular chaperone IbpA